MSTIRLREILKDEFGFDEFRPLQDEIIQAVIDGQDVMGILPTGGGKSLCYQLPALYFDGLTLVVSPLLALMEDQVRGLNQKGVPAAFLNSTQSKKEQEEVERKVFFGELKILYISPERAMAPSLHELLQNIEVSLIAIDEAHCVSQWGHDFRPEYRKLSLLREFLPETPLLALTATAGRVTRKDIKDGLKIKDNHDVIGDFDRPNIELNIQKKTTKEKDYLKLIAFIQDRFENQTGIVYCLSRKKTEEVASYLKAKGLKAYAYHAGQSNKERKKIQDIFVSKNDVLIVATIAFGMGIDKSNVRFVAHLDMPKSIESYYQEIGRAGRDGKESVAWAVYGKREMIMLKKMMNKGTSSIKRRRVNEQKLEAMLGLCEASQCRREVLLNYFDNPFKGPCYHCDNCYNLDLPKIDYSDEAILAMRTIHESKELFEVNTLIEILTGEESATVIKKGLTSLNSFGLGKSKSLNFWKAMYRQLASYGAIYIAQDGTTVTKLTEKSLPLLTKKEKLMLFEIDEGKAKIVKKVSKTKTKRAARPKVKRDLSCDKEKFEYLKEFRRALAKKKRTKAFKVFPDRTLEEFVLHKPKNLAEMESLFGVGPKKLKKFGKAFLEAIEEIS